MPDEDLPADPRDDAPEDTFDNPDTAAGGEDVYPDPDEEAPPSLTELDLGAEIESELTQERDERVSPLILSAAVIGVLVGLFVWGSLAMSVMSSADSIVDDASTGSDGSPATFEEPIDCEELAKADTLTEAQASAFVQQCGDAESGPESPETDPALNRADCDAIRGSDYRSPDEREWFLANCVQG